MKSIVQAHLAQRRLIKTNKTTFYNGIGDRNTQGYRVDTFLTLLFTDP